MVSFFIHLFLLYMCKLYTDVKCINSTKSRIETEVGLKSCEPNQANFWFACNEKKISKQISDMYREPLVIKHKVKRVTNLNAEFMIFFSRFILPWTYANISHRKKNVSTAIALSNESH